MTMVSTAKLRETNNAAPVDTCVEAAIESVVEESDTISLSQSE